MHYRYCICPYCLMGRIHHDYNAFFTGPCYLQHGTGDGLWRLFPWQRHGFGLSPRGHKWPKHREEHTCPKFHSVLSHWDHEATRQTLFKTPPELHHEPQLRDRLLLQSHLPPHIPALQHHLLEPVLIVQSNPFLGPDFLLKPPPPISKQLRQSSYFFSCGQGGCEQLKMVPQSTLYLKDILNLNGRNK